MDIYETQDNGENTLAAKQNVVDSSIGWEIGDGFVYRPASEIPGATLSSERRAFLHRRLATISHAQAVGKMNSESFILQS